MGLQGPDTIEKKFDENADLNIQISSKMSKSIPKSSIFVHDPPNDIKTKIKEAYCPPKQSKGNPILDLARYAVFAERESLEIMRPAKYGGSENFRSYEEVERAYVKGKIHPLDLKNSVAGALIEILKPVREHFNRHPKLLEKMIEIEVTR